MVSLVLKQRVERIFHPMAGASISPYGTEWGIGYLWHRMDWLVRLDVAVLGLLLVYTLAVVIRVYRCYRIAGRNTETNTATLRKLAAELNIQLGTLKATATVAPYVGLVGTCVGILSTFWVGVGTEKHAYIAWIMSKLAAALVPAAAGIVVAIPATCGYACARTRLELLVNEVPGRKRPLTTRFAELPPFALIPAFGLAVVFAACLTFASFRTPKGFDIQLASERCQDDNADRLIVLRLTNQGKVFINFEPQEWDTLSSRLAEIYSFRMQRAIYLVAEDDVPFQTVADALDAVRSTDLSIVVRLVTRRVINAPCP